MAGLWGADFVSSVPADTDNASGAAGIMRDIKSRMKAFGSIMFNLETGLMNAGAVTASMLANTAVTPGPGYNTVTVDAQGRVTAASVSTYPSSVASPSSSITAAIASGVLNVDLALGIPFHTTVTLTSAAAATPINIVLDAAVPAGKKVYITQMFGKVNGATVWATTSTVKIQDTNGTAVDFFTIPVASMTANAFINLASTLTVENAVALGTGGTTAKGLQIKGDVNGTGSNFVVTVAGWIK